MHRIFKKSIKLNQNQAEVYLNLGSIFFQIEDWKASLENFNKVIILDSKNVNAYFNRGIVFKKLSLMNEALNDLHYALSLDKNNFAYRSHIQKPMNFRLIYNKRLGYSYDIKPMIKMN